jgi:hypothetical protein
MKKSVTFESEELTDLQTAVIRMLWTWQARKEEKHPDADRYIKRYQQLYVKISGARWDKDLNRL